MPAGQYDFLIEAGATFRRVLRVSRAGIEPPERMDLTRWQPRLQIRPTSESLEVYLDCRPANGRIYVAPDPDSADLPCLIVIDLSDDDTRRMDFTDAVYDVIITDGTETRRLLQGKALVDQDTTK